MIRLYESACASTRVCEEEISFAVGATEEAARNFVHRIAMQRTQAGQHKRSATTSLHEKLSQRNRRPDNAIWKVMDIGCVTSTLGNTRFGRSDGNKRRNIWRQRDTKS